VIHTHHKVPVIDSDFEHARDHLIGLVEDIYTTGSVSNLEFHLEEILGVFQLHLPKTDPLIQYKPEVDEMLNDWVDFNQSYAKSLVPTKKGAKK